MQNMYCERIGLKKVIKVKMESLKLNLGHSHDTYNIFLKE